MTGKFDLKELLRRLQSNSTITNVLLVGVLTLLTRGFGFVKEIIIADSFGLSELLDTFYIAVLIPGFISNVFLGGFKSVFIPNYVIEMHSGKHVGSFQSTCFILVFGISLFFCLIAFLGTDVYLETFFKGHDGSYYELIKTQFYFVMPSIVFWGMTSLINGLLTIYDEFVFSSLGVLFPAITIIICILFFKEELGAVVLAVGTLVGSAANFMFQLSIALRKKIITLKRPDFVSPNVKETFRQIPAKISANLLTGVNDIVDQYFAATLVVGSIAALNYGVKIPMFTIGIATMALGKVLLPYFSKKVLENREQAFKELSKILKYLLLATSIVAIIIIIISSPLISLIFERNAFTSSDTTIVAKIQQMYLIQVPSYITGIIMVRFLESINKNKFMAWLAVWSLLFNIALNAILIRSMGVYGLALATALVSVVNSIFLYLYINHLKRANA